MSETAVKTEILEPMQLMWQPPRGETGAEDASKAMLQYIDALKQFNAEELRQAWLATRDTHTRYSWPSVAVFVKAANQARKFSKPPQVSRVENDKAKNWAEWERVRQTDDARRAAVLGFSWSLKCLILYDGKSLAQIDMADLERAHDSAADLAAELEGGGFIGKNGVPVEMPFEFARRAVDLWRGILINEAETAIEVAKYNAL